MNIHLIGCGGVGSYLAPVLVKTFPQESIILWDGDTLEERNLDRQLFKQEQIGLNKASALSQLVGGESRPQYFTYGAETFSPSDILIVAVDNHPARKAALMAADSDGCVTVLAMNEYTESQAILYLPEWCGTKLDPRIRYPAILSDTADDPTRPRGCTGAAVTASPQLALANAIAAQLAISHLYWFIHTRPLLNDEVILNCTPVEHLWSAGSFKTTMSKNYE
jgi:hypothetical protein